MINVAMIFIDPIYWSGSTLCPDGFFKFSKQCYKLFTDTKRNWQEAKDHCVSQGLVMAAKPDDAVALRKYLVETLGKQFIALD